MVESRCFKRLTSRRGSTDGKQGLFEKGEIPLGEIQLALLATKSVSSPTTSPSKQCGKKGFL